MTTTTSVIPAVQTVHADSMDCLQANLAVLADHYHGPGTHLALGARLSFGSRTGEDGFPTVEPTLADQLSAAERLLGLSIIDTAHPAGPAAAVDLAGRHDLLYLVADAYHLPWTPYHGQRHLGHSFLTRPHQSGVLVIDAYRNTTPWGAARPGQWELTAEEFASALTDTAVAVLFEPTTAPASPAPSAEPGTDEQHRQYLTVFAEHQDRESALDKLTLETWLLTRYRRLHAEYRGAAFVETAYEHLRQWDLLAEQTYLACRRVQRGRAEPGGLTDRLAELLHTDHEVFLGSGRGATKQPPAARLSPVPGELWRTVARTAAEVLGVDEERLLGDQELTRVPSFSSFRIIEIVERLERQLGVEFDPADLVPENLHHVDGVCRVATRSLVTAARTREAT